MSKKQIQVAKGNLKADLVLKNGNVVNVFTESIEIADVAICDGMIVGIGEYAGITEIDCTGKVIAPGFIDGHIHLESSMMNPVEFAKVVLPHGTTAVITDPHEIANVCGTKGIDYMIEASKDLPLDIYFVLPSCVPAAPLDESGAILLAADLEAYYKNDRVLGLGEVMDFVGTIEGAKIILDKIADAQNYKKVVDGHAPGITGKELCAYLTAGVESDHETSNEEEAMERIKRGQWVMIREGTAAKNLDGLMPLFQMPYAQRAILVTDDKHPGDLLVDGHMNSILRKAVANGADPCIAIKMATLNTAHYFGLSKVGAVAPGYQADIAVLADMTSFLVEEVYKSGKQVAQNNQCLVSINPTKNGVNEELRNVVYESFHLKALEIKDFHSTYQGTRKPKQMRVIKLQEGQLLTDELIEHYEESTDGICLEKDIIKLAVIERHNNTGHMGLAYMQGYGLQKGAIASSVAHDSHNIIVAGATEQDMCVAANCVREMQGGWAVVKDGIVVDKLPLPIAGLMSELSAATLEAQIAKMKCNARDLGVAEGVDPFMTLAFISLPVIPNLKLTTSGLVDVFEQKIVPTLF